ncbi:MAG: YkgJ family cysteine cluster protein [Candidatus Micrarchaeota archaeon]
MRASNQPLKRFDPTKFKCSQCGACCKAIGGRTHVRITGSDWRRLIITGHTEVFSHLEDASRGLGAQFLLPLYYKKRGKLIRQCPFLGSKKVGSQPQYFCKIHNVKPDACKGFPFTPQEFKEHELLNALSNKIGRKRRRV